MKEGWSGTSRGANVWFSRDGARALHPGDFGRSLSRHSLRDVSKPRRPSTQPLVNGSQSTACLQAPALSPHSKGDIRTAPPSRSRVKNDYSILGMLSRGKQLHCMKIVMAVLDTATPSEDSRVDPRIKSGDANGGLGGPAMTVLQYVMRGLDPRICRWREMARSSPAIFVRRFAGQARE